MITLMLSQPRLETSAPLHAEATFDPPIVRPGERTVYRLTINALQDVVAWDGELPKTKLEFRPGASGQTMQMVGTNFQPRTSFNFHTLVPTEGKFVIPSFSIAVGGKSVRVPETSVLAANVQNPTSPQMLYLEVTPQRPFVGEAAQVRILSPSSPSGVVQALGQVQLIGSGFIHELTANRQSIQTLPFGGRTTPHYIYETTLTPISPGVSEIYAQAFAVGNRFTGSIVISGPAVISGSTLQYTLLDSDPLQLTFRPLPLEGRPPGFNGAVGVYSVEPPKISTNQLRPGEPLEMTVLVRGRGNLGRLSLPEPPVLADWQVLPPRRENLPIQVVNARGFASFTYTLVPLRGGLKATPTLPFSFFNPEEENYVAPNIPAVPIVVTPGEVPSDFEGLLRQRLANTTKKPELSSLAAAPGAVVSSLAPIQLRGWFPFVQAAPAILFLGLWQWDRRRRFLEAHPEIVLRRRARRELWRERKKMRSAARSGDDPAFQRAALRAVQAAAAPNFPAHPDAVLSAEAVRLVGDQPSEVRGALERLFESNNLNKYAGRTPPQLLQEQEKLERVLQALEAKLQ